MNEATCGVGVNCYRFWDVELWVNTNANVWCSAANLPGFYKWIGDDGGCGGPACNGCYISAPWVDVWTYRIYVRE